MKCSKWPITLLVVLFVCSNAQSSEEINLDDILDLFDSNPSETRAFFLSQEALHSVENIVQQMPQGWPQLGIPPLAPFVKNSVNMNVANDLINFQSSLKPLKIVGLNDLNINSLNVGAIFREVAFDFMFPKITVSGKFDTAFKLPFLSPLPTSALSLKGNGDLDLSLENVRINGTFRYKMPFFVGWSRVYDFKTTLNLEQVRSNLKGTINAIPIAKQINDLLEHYLGKGVNGNNVFWSSLLEQLIVPRVNGLLEGKTMWKLFWWAMSPK